MKCQYLRFPLKAICFFLTSTVLLISCRHDESVQEFSRQQEDAVTTTPTAVAEDNDIRAFAVAAPVTYNIFPATSSGTVQSAPAREVGVKLRVTQAGYITGIRFYKNTVNTGTHIGHLWSSTGTKLAEATFAGETASGWQQVLFTTPVAVTTGKTYVASYFTSTGYHAITTKYFTSAVVNGPVRALATGEDGGNGVYKNSTVSTFPDIASGIASNFWVDVVFSTNVTQPPVTPPPPPPATGIKYLVLPRGTAQEYSNKSNLVIENLQFSSTTGHNLRFNNCSNITIRNCYLGASPEGLGIVLYKCNNITIEKSLFANNQTMILAQECTGNIKILNNQFVNAKGPFIRGQFVQFNTCTGAGNLVQGNKGECFEGRSDPAELINIYKSTGTSASPITIKDNIFRGGGPSTAGGGVMCGDVGGNWILVENNKLVNPGAQGIGIAGGHNITVRGNQVFAVKKPWNGVGMYVWSQAGAGCDNITVTNNRVSYTNKNGAIYNWWNGGGCSALTYSAPTSITLAEMNVPAHLIDFITPAELLTIK